MIQKWYNRIMWTSGSITAGGMVFLFPAVMLLSEEAIIILDTIAIFIPVSGIIFISLMFGDIFSGYRHFGAWVNHRYDKPLDQSE